MGMVMKWLGRPGAVRALGRARTLLENSTPLKTDCGKLCGGACCQSDDTGDNGMLLFPYEEAFYWKPIPGFPFRLLPDDTLVRDGFRLVCEGSCPRIYRPLACRLFPLRIRMVCDPLGEDTQAVAEIDPRAWAVCPLPEEGGLRALSPAFVEAVEQAGNALLSNVYLLEALHNEQRLLDEMRQGFAVD